MRGRGNSAGWGVSRAAGPRLLLGEGMMEGMSVSCSFLTPFFHAKDPEQLQTGISVTVQLLLITRAASQPPVLQLLGPPLAAGGASTLPKPCARRITGRLLHGMCKFGFLSCLPRSLEEHPAA